ncbi:DegT/DnrJ/EryC1/StrS family aminotransferase [Saccharopolyspora hirsuta]|uniref:DegT/DnrJ/EryC1/StrS family aminotransferase n=1 Tax=Saccharopolyspora hirsuta TaxID=1837 RepID=UPI0033246B9C
MPGGRTGSRSDITVTSFAMAHIVTCAGNGGMVCLDDELLRDRALMLRAGGDGARNRTCSARPAPGGCSAKTSTGWPTTTTSSSRPDDSVVMARRCPRWGWAATTSA